MTEPPATPVALTIAGSDSGGGAGIQADLKTFHQFGVFGTSAVTAVTAQNTHGVAAVGPVSAEVVAKQISAVFSDLGPRAVKTGMLFDEDVVLATAEALRRAAPPHTVPLVVDPVMVATSGDRLLRPGAVRALVSELLPLAALVTPNLPEAEILTGVRLSQAARGSVPPGDTGMLAARRRAAQALVARGAGAALVKGGHGKEKIITDLLWDGSREWIWRGERHETVHTHGTGCTLSAAVTAGLALGRTLPAAVRDAVEFTRLAVATAPGLGGGRGPVNHWVSADSDPDSTQPDRG